MPRTSIRYELLNIDLNRHYNHQQFTDGDLERTQDDLINRTINCQEHIITTSECEDDQNDYYLDESTFTIEALP